jgi:hypothetical protein
MNYVAKKSSMLGLGVASLAVTLSALSGCTGYSSWPPIDEEKESFTQINYLPAPNIVGDALAMAVLRYPPVANPQRGVFYDGPIAISLPEGATYETYGVITRRVGANAQPTTASNTELPTYYVGRVWLRATVAEVDIFVPAPRFGETGAQRHQKITVFFAGGTQPWRITAQRAHPVGLFPTPTRTMMPQWGGGPSNTW